MTRKRYTVIFTGFLCIYNSLLSIAFSWGNETQFHYVRQNFQIVDRYRNEEKTVGSRIECAFHCSLHNTCGTFSYGHLDNKCNLFTALVSSSSVHLGNQTDMTMYTMSSQPIIYLNDGYISANGLKKSYKLFLAPETQSEAMDMCQSSGSSLLKIQSRQEWRLIYNYLFSIDPSIRIQLDANDVTEGIWKSSDGSEISFLPWHYSEPNTCCMSYEDCLEILIGQYGTYNDFYCQPLSFICEKDIT